LAHCNQYGHYSGVCPLGLDGFPSFSGDSVLRERLVSKAPTTIPFVKTVANVYDKGVVDGDVNKDEQIRISLRNEKLSDDNLVIIRAGSGDPNEITKHAITSYPYYKRLLDDDGLFCISVYGVANGVTIDDIKASFSNPMFGFAKFGDITKFVTVLPTVIMSDDVNDNFAKMQSGHYDLVLDVPRFNIDERRLRTLVTKKRKAKTELWVEVREYVDKVVPLFNWVPREELTDETIHA